MERQLFKRGLVKLSKFDKPGAVPGKTDQELVDGANDLALKFAKTFGWVVPNGFKFYDQPRSFWMLAVMACDHVNGTDIENALAEGQNG
jgi:hypothetical protein